MRYALCAMPALRKVSEGGRSAVLKNGAVAQLGERQNRTLEAAGSIPVCSTKREGANSNGLAPFSSMGAPWSHDP